MLLIDGVKYQEWIPKSEEEFEEIIKEHAKDIFGEGSIYFDLKKKLTTKAGIGSIPDGYVIKLQEEPCWYICEVEFHTHSLYEHIIAQLQKIINAAKTLQSQKVVTDAIYSEIKSAPFKEALIKSKIGSEDIHHFVANLISKPPILVIPIDRKIDGLEEACDGLPVKEVRVVEFRTFAREDVGLAVHAHVFEPLYRPQVITPKVTIVSERAEVTPAPIPQDTLEVIIRNPSFINFHLFYIPKGKRSFFPGYEVPFILETTDIGEIETYVTSAKKGTQVGDPNAGYYIQAKLAEWYRRHPALKVGDRVIFKAIEPMKRYRLELLK